MNYQLICSDIDGTLLNKDRELSKETIAQVKRVAPIPMVLISSRMPKALRHLQQEFGNASAPIIAYNGGLVLDQERVLHSTFIKNEVLAQIINQCSNTSIHLSLFHADEWYVPSMDYWAKREENNTKVTPEINKLSRKPTFSLSCKHICFLYFFIQNQRMMQIFNFVFIVQKF